MPSRWAVRASCSSAGATSAGRRLLAIGPLFIAFLLFDNTRSLFEGWLRVLAGAALATLGATLTLSLQLAFLEPWLGSALARRQAGEALPSLPTELFVLTLVFTIILVAAVLASARITRAFRLAPWLPQHSPAADTQTSHTSSRSQQEQVLEHSESNRTTALVRQLTASDAREAALRVVSGTNRAEWRGQALAEASGAPVGGRAPALGQSFRRSRPRLTRSAERRDSR